jgi:hypothetical protein
MARLFYLTLFVPDREDRIDPRSPMRRNETRRQRHANAHIAIRLRHRPVPVISTAAEACLVQCGAGSLPGSRSPDRLFSARRQAGETASI